MSILNDLMVMQDLEYREFHKKILGVDVPLIGIRTPEIKRYAKSIANSDDAKQFLNSLPHKYYDENLLHGLILCYRKMDYDSTINYLNKFLPYIDNWAVCDMTVCNMKKLSSEINKTFELAMKLCDSDEPWIIRVGVVIMLDYLVKTKYIGSCCGKVVSIKSQEYYVNMARAWMLSVAGVYDYNYVYDVLVNHKLDTFTHNMTIRKICESFRFGKEQKEEVKKLKI